MHSPARFINALIEKIHPWYKVQIAEVTNWSVRFFLGGMRECFYASLETGGKIRTLSEDPQVVAFADRLNAIMEGKVRDDKGELDEPSVSRAKDEARRIVEELNASGIFNNQILEELKKRAERQDYIQSVFDLIDRLAYKFELDPKTVILQDYKDLKERLAIAVKEPKGPGSKAHEEHVAIVKLHDTLQANGAIGVAIADSVPVSVSHEQQAATPKKVSRPMFQVGDCVRVTNNSLPLHLHVGQLIREDVGGWFLFECDSTTRKGWMSGDDIQGVPQGRMPQESPQPEIRHGYKTGDWVKVAKPAKDAPHCGLTWVPAMDGCDGRVMQIKTFKEFTHGCFSVSLHGAKPWVFHVNWLTPAEQPKPDPKGTLKRLCVILGSGNSDFDGKIAEVLSQPNQQGVCQVKVEGLWFSFINRLMLYPLDQWKPVQIKHGEFAFTDENKQRFLTVRLSNDGKFWEYGKRLNRYRPTVDEGRFGFKVDEYLRGGTSWYKYCEYFDYDATDPVVKQSLTTEPPNGWRWVNDCEELRKGDEKVKRSNGRIGFIRRNKFEVGEMVVDRRGQYWEVDSIINGVYQLKNGKILKAGDARDLSPYLPSANVPGSPDSSAKPEPPWAPKVGDWVRIKKPRDCHELKQFWLDSMEKYDGIIVQVEWIEGEVVLHDGRAFHFRWLWPAEDPRRPQPAPPKRYREPTQEDLQNGPIKCEVRGAADLDWEWVVLVGICDGKYRFAAWSKTIKPNRLVQYPHCRIEAT